MKLEVKFDEKELKMLTGKLSKMVKENPALAKEVLTLGAFGIETAAKENVITKTGRLKNSIHVRTSDQVSSKEGKLIGGSSYSYSDDDGDDTYTDTLSVSLGDLEVAVGTDVVYAYKIHTNGGVRTNAISGGNGKQFLFRAKESETPKIINLFKKRLSEIG